MVVYYREGRGEIGNPCLPIKIKFGSAKNKLHGPYFGETVDEMDKNL